MISVEEPVLEMDDIQGIAVPGFFKPHQTLLQVRVDAKSVRDLQGFLREFQPSTAAEVLEDRRGHRAGRGNRNGVLSAVGLSWPVLRQLTPDATAIPSPAFQIGLVGRSSLLGDPDDPDQAGHVTNWKTGAPGRELDVLIVLAGDDRSEVTKAAHKISAQLVRMGVHVTAEDGDILPGDLAGHEHFGFDDGVSQPGIRGRASAAPDDYVTPRYVDPDSDPVAAATSGYPGQSLVWPGEFVLGYPATGPDPLRPGPVAKAVPEWTKNGSFLVFRRLRQDVALFWQWIHAQVQAEVKAGATSLDDISLAARLVGRWPSGAPFNRTPEADNPVMGGDPFENNNFIYNSDTPNVKFGRGDGSAPKGTKFPTQMAGADPAGITCPWAAHIRKVNTRDSPSDVGSTTATYARRVLRVGVPYGPPIEDRYTNDGVDRGLLFLSVQSSIEEQFEFLQSRWMNDPTRPKTPGGNDMLVGQNTPAEGHVRSCNIFLPGVTASPSILSAPRQFVIPTGGGYFFLPSLSALRGVISGI